MELGGSRGIRGVGKAGSRSFGKLGWEAGDWGIGELLFGAGRRGRGVVRTPCYCVSTQFAQWTYFSLEGP